MSPPGVWWSLVTEIPYPLSSTKKSIGSLRVVAMVSADQKPLVATAASPPRTTAMASSHAASPS